MFRRIKRFFSEMQQRRRYADRIAPNTIGRLAAELRGLTELAVRTGPRHAVPYERIQRIQAEMDQLLDLVGRPEFNRLSVQRRLELHDSLLQSRELLIESVQTTPAPTDRLQ
ncbi:hypothetical protein Dde_1115 [Oleidesulfovibrio alaskensis G20]|jgi:hypothetical protein|uniref:Uncharacterized protein n=1 Tax=Oleidesulfovibrio alaskensis (strain ATCC BAA-1058 / DSM 17464 / G20) TaxID=207559 RepID=Q313I0_OLEA2|nr:hypothetical protein [Oleidesulfovibrio alaskensis]ABB37916.1 hypothetical protein Dde_1115 [Oleidesulfovibrio alaskensis G20]MBG0772931.1 hypothetical protein [Oleidesulfovibrio alaskensis]MBL3582514.1 hypothetical protein [Oleidesulfovibrio alaskensis]